MRRVSSLAVGLGLVALCAHVDAQVSRPFAGVTLVRNPSRAMVVVDLCAAGVSVRATQYPERRATPRGWAEPRGLEVAINADFFDFPGWTWVIGRARGRGVDWPAGAQFREPGRPYWAFGPQQALGIGDGTRAPDPGVTEIVGGHNVILAHGRSTGPWAPANDGALLNSSHARTAIGLSADRRTLYLLSTSNAINAATLIDYLNHDAAQAGAPPIDYATNQDGGGSSQMYVRGLGQVVNTGRLVNNHLGIEANGGSAAPTNCVPRYAATFRAQSFPGASAGAIRLTVGQSALHWIELTNTGTQPWLPNVTRLAPTPRDRPSPVGGAGWLSATRVSTVTASVAPGATFRFPVRFTATRAGDFHQHFGVVQEGVTWFSQPTLGGGPPDDFLEAHVIVTPAPMDAGVRDAAVDASALDATSEAGTRDVSLADAGARDTASDAPDDGAGDDVGDDVGGADAEAEDVDLQTPADATFVTPDVDESDASDASSDRAEEPPGCGCTTQGTSRDRDATVVFAAAMASLRARRRRFRAGVKEPPRRPDGRAPTRT